jgi:uncharacterized membrane protein
MSDMELTGRLHPLLVHFPIGLVLLAALAELAATVTHHRRWHVVAAANVRAGAFFATGAAIAGWLLAQSAGTARATTLEWHGWLATVATSGTVLAALAAAGAGRSARTRWIYRVLLFGSAAAVAVAGHLGGVMVWGADFFHP